MTPRSEDLKMPQAEPNGFVPTLNNMGYMTSTLDVYSQKFVEFAPVAPGPCLDVGAAYGVATLAALERGAHVIANDLDERHLEILKARAPEELRNKVQLRAGSFPDDLEFAPGSLGAALLCRVLHFFDGPSLSKAAGALYSWLRPGGKVFAVAETPYLRNFTTFIPIYEERKKTGAEWPGFVDDVMAIAPFRGKTLPPQIHFLDPDVLRAVFRDRGFIVEEVGTFARPDFPEDIRLDGRESVGIVATKP